MIYELSSNIFWTPPAKNDRPVLGLIVGEKDSLIIDAGNSITHFNEFITEINDLAILNSPVKYLVLTHWHWDHVFGLAAFNGISIAQKITYEKIEEMQLLSWRDPDLDFRLNTNQEIPFIANDLRLEYPNPNRSISIKTPTLSFLNSVKIDLGKFTCEIEHIGGDHSADSTMISCNDVTFIGDSIYPNLHQEESYIPKNIFKIYEKLLAKKSKYYVQSHDAPLSYEYMEKTYKIFKYISNQLQNNITPNQILQKILSNQSIAKDITFLQWNSEDINYYISAFLKGMKIHSSKD